MNRKEVGEELYRQKFEEFGLSDRFEFISRDWNTDHVDHVIPLAAGGKHSWDNAKVCCGMCNILKSDKVVGV